MRALRLSPAVSNRRNGVPFQLKSTPTASRVSPGSGPVDHALLADQRVDEGRLAGIRTADDVDTDRPVGCLVGCLAGLAFGG